LDKNTHLIAEVPQGPKYELAAANPQTMKVISSSWLYMAQQTKRRPLEAEHAISSTQQPIHQSRSFLLTCLEDAMNLLLENQLQRRALFQHHQFYLLGFDNANASLKTNLGTLIRRGNGTIYWEVNEDVTVLVLCDNCDPALFDAAQIVSQHHVNLPPSVSPLWIIESYHQNKLKSTHSYPPIRSILSTSATMLETRKKSTARVSTQASNSNVFQGCLFSFLITKVGDEYSSASEVLVFDIQEQAAFVKAHGGQLLSSKLVEALKSDAAQNHSETKTKRKCFVVCWGGGNPRINTSLLVSQIKRDNLCDVRLVTPLWVQTCVTVRKRVRLERMPLIFIPQSWSMKSINSKANHVKKDGYKRRFHPSLTGFQGTEKAVIIHLIGAMGGLYHDHMSNSSTHLICKEKAVGIKLEKATEWGLHIVPIEWLYHVLQHGYGGVEKQVDGCERRFSLLAVDGST
jgi:hypothetical protein